MQTKRPLNECEDCGYTWHPRGKNISLVCPHCRSTDISHWITSEPLISGWKLMLGGIAAIVIGVSLLSNDNRSSDTTSALLILGGGISFLVGNYSD